MAYNETVATGLFTDFQVVQYLIQDRGAKTQTTKRVSSWY
jgi:hypothetical protein